jgi:peroxiredoxin
MIGGNMVKRVVVVAVCLAIISGCAGGGRVAADRIEVGDKAPGFVLSDIFGMEKINSSKLVHNSNATVIVIWSMACPNCREALMDIQKVHEDYAAKAMTFIGVNVDRENLQGVKAFLKAEGIDFTTVWDSSARVAREYRALDYTFSVFVVNREGRVIMAQYDHPPDLALILAETLDEVLAAM